MSKHSSKGASWEALRKACLDRDGWVCGYCGRGLIGADATADHITPLAQGGVDELWNLRASCRRCNSIKQDRPFVRTDYFNTSWIDWLL